MDPPLKPWAAPPPPPEPPADEPEGGGRAGGLPAELRHAQVARAARPMMIRHPVRRRAPPTVWHELPAVRPPCAFPGCHEAAARCPRKRRRVLHPARRRLPVHASGVHQVSLQANSELCVEHGARYAADCGGWQRDSRFPQEVPRGGVGAAGPPVCRDPCGPCPCREGEHGRGTDVEHAGGRPRPGQSSAAARTPRRTRRCCAAAATARKTARDRDCRTRGQARRLERADCVGTK